MLVGSASSGFLFLARVLLAVCVFRALLYLQTGKLDLVPFFFFPSPLCVGTYVRAHNNTSARYFTPRSSSVHPRAAPHTSRSSTLPPHRTRSTSLTPHHAPRTPLQEGRAKSWKRSWTL